MREKEKSLELTFQIYRDDAASASERGKHEEISISSGNGTEI